MNVNSNKSGYNFLSQAVPFLSEGTFADFNLPLGILSTLITWELLKDVKNATIRFIEIVV